MTDKINTVAIIIAAYNAEKWIARAVTSALAEREVSEVIVVDDASKDNTADTARAADDGTGRLTVLVQPQNGGPSAARNRAIHESTSEWIGILDADDFFLAGRIKGLLAHAQEADLIADDLWQVAETDIHGTRRSLLGDSIKLPCAIDLKTFVQGNISQKGKSRGELGFIKPLMRRSFLEAHSIHYQENMRLGEDYELYVRALGNGARLLLLPAQGYISVVRSNSLSGLHSETDLFNLRESDKALLDSLNLSAAEKSVLRQHYLSIDCRLQWRLLILAVKKRDVKAALQCFLRPYPVPFYVLGQLLGQVFIRFFKVISLRGKHAT